MKTLVTGGAGYIGSVVAARLRAAGCEVVVVDDLSKGHRWAVGDDIRFERVDLSEPASIERVLEERFDVVLHFAALSLVGESIGDPSRYFRSNIVAAVNLLEGMRRAGVERLVFSSTAAVYGEPDEVPIAESAPTRPTNPYGASKLAIDQLIGFEAAIGNVRATSLRYFNVAGSAYDLGEVHEPETHLIPLALQAAAGRRKHVEIYGTDYPTPDGTAIRDYIHVDDLAEAHLLAMERTTEPGHHIFNLGNGTGFSVREVIETAREVTGCQIPAVESGRRQGDPAVLVASSERISSELGWKPHKPELATMIEDAWAWVRANPDKV